MNCDGRISRSSYLGFHTQHTYGSPLPANGDSVRRRCSVLQWHPDFATQLIVASDDDSSPSLRQLSSDNTKSSESHLSLKCKMEHEEGGDDSVRGQFEVIYGINYILQLLVHPFLQAYLDQHLQLPISQESEYAKGEITYNGHNLNQSEQRRTSAYISQNDVHVGEMTVKETLDFSARCQGVGSRLDLLAELTRREKQAGIYPEAEVDLFMKATAIEGDASNLIVYYTLRILGLDVCCDTFVGDAMLRGISGGEKKRVTTGEMLVGPTKTLFMDDISTGLDSSTTFQIVKCLQHVVQLTESTIMMSLLQPAPETFDLFDDIILLSESQIVYQGPREHVLEFFMSCGFMCPDRKGTADFLQEVTSRKDQEQYWADRSKPYRYIPVSEFAQQFKHFHVGEKLNNELLVPYDKTLSHNAALVFQKYMVSKTELLKASWNKEWLLLKRNRFIYIFKSVQFIIIAFIGMTLFFRTTMNTRDEEDGPIYIGALLLSLLINFYNGLAEISLTIIIRLPVIFKQRDLLFHPPWAYTLPTILLRVPISIFESISWLAILYYGVGFAPEASRFFKHLLVVFMIQNVAGGLFRLIAGLCRTMNNANAGGTLVLLLVFFLGGIIIPKTQIPDPWEWGYWVSPLSYGFNAFAVNEFLAPRWMNKMSSDNVTSLGIAILQNMDIPTQTSWFWIGTASLLGFAVLFNVLFTFVLMYLDSPGKTQAIISKEAASEIENQQDTDLQPRLENIPSKQHITPQSLHVEGYGPSKKNKSKHIDIRYHFIRECVERGQIIVEHVDSKDQRADILTKALAYVKHGEMRNLIGVTNLEPRAFRPGVLTALMGVSGAGKTTLMDVLAGRKTGYCEQTDIHSPTITVHESLIYSAFLRLPKEVANEEKMTFVDQVMELVELDNLKNAIVGIPGVTGLSTEQRKRLTIAVELVANPSIIFMDEPTSGLDARAAAIVMRTVRNTVDTGRTVVCTIHQPSIDIFESFDELLLIKRGGQVIYAGPVGRNSEKIIEYFEEIPGVPKMPERTNPATWMLEVSSNAAAVRLDMDFSEYFRSSELQQRNKHLVMQLNTPPRGAADLHFGTQYSQSTWGQFKYCLWKMWCGYWRNPDYNLFRNFFTLATALIVGTMFWKIGEKRENINNLNTIIGAMYSGVFFVGMNNCQTVQPVVAIERIVFYRERAAGMYAVLPYALAQVFVEIPYVLLETTYYTIIVYAMVSFEWTTSKFLWSFFINFFSFLYFTYYGLMTVSITPNEQLAAIFAASFYSLFNFFSGFYIPRPRIPKWWVWYYWMCPLAWTAYVESTIKVPGMAYDPPINLYIQKYYGYRLDFMGPVIVVLVGFCVLFSGIYVFCLKTLNFQVR
ncbi:hypothetical protein LXL04_008404 [Taraxacum kok-saghyz]